MAKSQRSPTIAKWTDDRWSVDGLRRRQTGVCDCICNQFPCFWLASEKKTTHGAIWEQYNHTIMDLWFPSPFSFPRTIMESGSVPMPSSTASPPLYSFPSSSVLTFLCGTTPTWFYTTAAIVASLLCLEQVVYRYKKRHLPGATWTIPLIGKFADSTSPSMECYKKQWDSGALSAVSVFNMYVLWHLVILHSLLTLSFLPASLSWLRQMNFLVRSSILRHTPNLVLCIRLSKSFVQTAGKLSLSVSSRTLIFFW